MAGRKCVLDDVTTPTLLFGVNIGATRHGGAASLRRTKSADHIPSAASAVDDHESGYLTDVGINSSESRHKRREIGKPWSEDEHRKFLEGLEKLGKGDWKGISTKFVPTRKSSQVASHAQKYFNRLHLSADAKRRRRHSVFDISLTDDGSQPAQGSQSNDVDINSASSSSAATTKNVDQPNVMPNVSVGHQTHAVMPRISWVPIVNYSNQNAVYVPDFNGSYTAAVMPWSSQDALRLAWLQAGVTAPSTKSNEELNINIRNLRL